MASPDAAAAEEPGSAHYEAMSGAVSGMDRPFRAWLPLRDAAATWSHAALDRGCHRGDQIDTHCIPCLLDAALQA